MKDLVSQAYLKSSGLYLVALLLSIIYLQSGCDFILPKNSFKLAVPEKDYSYYFSAKHIKAFLEEVDIILR